MRYQNRLNRTNASENYDTGCDEQMIKAEEVIRVLVLD